MVGDEGEVTPIPSSVAVRLRKRPLFTPSRATFLGPLACLLNRGLQPQLDIVEERCALLRSRSVRVE
jgi:hypothetical protein